MKRIDNIIDEITTELPGTFYDPDEETDSWCEECGLIIAKKILPEVTRAIRETKLETLREAAKKICEYCTSPLSHECSVATMEHGSWRHRMAPDSGEYPWNEHCRAAAIHDMIAEIEGADDD